jgi:hypothetical protein|mmetsp:Transcript_51991/g.86643  ORF Transcript_51991/g.86643 Transcript_51991/m.86643 type:complete len:111 (-) Transcript_51991:191-523(-)
MHACTGFWGSSRPSRAQYIGMNMNASLLPACAVVHQAPESAVNISSHFNEHCGISSVPTCTLISPPSLQTMSVFVWYPDFHSAQRARVSVETQWKISLTWVLFICQEGIC